MVLFLWRISQQFFCLNSPWLSNQISNILTGSRIIKLKRSVFMKRNLMSTLVFALYVVVLSYIAVAVALVSGQGMWNNNLCVAGTWVCLMFYTGSKAIL